MSRTRTILVVDDDPHIREVVRYALERAGYAVTEAEDGRAALACYEHESPALLVLDILMPEMQGTDVCREIRKVSEVPIIFLSSCDEDTDRIIGLELGGDDYVTKPFSPRELVARVKAVLRRFEGKGEKSAEDASPKVLRHGRLALDGETYKVLWDRTEVVLTATEFGLLQVLLGYPAKVYSRTELMERALGENLVVTDRTIDSHIRRIRKKFKPLGADPVETVHGIGYKLADCR